MPSSTITLAAADGFSRPLTSPSRPACPKGAIVVLQEIFGVNSHIRGGRRRLCRRRLPRGRACDVRPRRARCRLGYTPDDMAQGSRLKAAVEALPAPGVLQDIQAAVAHARQSRQGRHRRLLLGRPAGLARGRKAARPVGGGGVLRRRHDGRQRAIAQARGADDGAFRRPGRAHLGGEREGVRAGASGSRSPLYAANHGFNCEQRGSYNASAAATALERSLYHFGKHIG